MHNALNVPRHVLVSGAADPCFGNAVYQAPTQTFEQGGRKGMQ